MSNVCKKKDKYNKSDKFIPRTNSETLNMVAFLTHTNLSQIMLIYINL